MEMENDLKRLLAGTRIERDLLSLLTAAAGGRLTATDLAELTDHSPWEVADQLRTVSGRSFTTRPGQWRGDPGSDVYLLGHEELHKTAVEMLGPRQLSIHRQQLSARYDRYKTAGWPPQTPEYLLSGYFNMIRDQGDTDRMIGCVTDSARYDRMLDLSGGDQDSHPASHLHTDHPSASPAPTVARETI